jgi:hypothetical protein
MFAITQIMSEKKNLSNNSTISELSFYTKYVYQIWSHYPQSITFDICGFTFYFVREKIIIVGLFLYHIRLIEAVKLLYNLILATICSFYSVRLTSSEDGYVDISNSRYSWRSFLYK